MAYSNLDLEPYRLLLCKLVPLTRRDNFDLTFKRAMIKSGIDKKLHFIMKMELKRLMKPTNQPIDLRGHVDGECELFEYESIHHHLDEIAQAIFIDQLKNFGAYTVGVYECTMHAPNNYRVMHLQEKAGEKVDLSYRDNLNRLSRVSHLTDTIPFNNYHVRKEERMHFVSDVLRVVDDKSTIIGHSVDISKSGCKLKAQKDTGIVKGQKLELKFVKFEMDFEFGLEKGLDYQVVSFDDSHDEFTLLGLKRLPCIKTARFDAFLAKYITGNKRRYRVNVNNAVESVLSRGYGQYSMPRRTDIALFLREKETTLEPYVAVVTELNRKTVEYWQDKQKNLFIHHALTPQRLKLIKQKLEQGQSDTYLYTFSGTNQAGDKIFYAALREELERNLMLRNTFWSFGCKKYDFRVFCITMTESDAEYAHQPISLDSENIKVFRELNKKPSAQVQGKLRGLSHILAFKDITSEFNRPEYVSDSVRQEYLASLKEFKVRRSHKGSLLMVPIKFIDVRREERFDIKTSVTLESDTLSLEGATLDLSTKGLKVRFDSPVKLSKGLEVEVGFPEFMEEEQALNLSALNYQVVAVNEAGDECSLCISGDVRSHRGRVFIRDLIRKNRNHLLDYQSGKHDSELAMSVQNILASSCSPTTAFLTKKGRHFETAKLSPGTMTFPLMEHLRSDEKVDMGFLFERHIYQRFLEVGMGSRHQADKSELHDIYFSVAEGNIDARLDIEFTSSDERIDFIKQALEKGQFFGISATIAKTSRPDMSRINPELTYISIYSMHKGKQIEDELWKVCGLVDFKDITSEILFRHNLNATGRNSLGDVA